MILCGLLQLGAVLLLEADIDQQRPHPCAGNVMALPRNKPNIVATIGPASESPETLQRLIRAGLNVARLNFSHGDFSSHAEHIRRIRSTAEAVGRRVAIMADLPGPKMRIGTIEPEPIHLEAG